jgi:5'-nucleotidase
MSELGYHAATIGNHDFDAGIEGFAKQLKHANFPFIISNYNFDNTCLDGKTMSNRVFQRGKLKIGVFGLGIELSGLVPSNLYKETKYLDPIEIAKDQVRFLRNEQDCDLIICLSHLGYEYRSTKVSDKILGRSVDGIDLIIGGHTHTFLPEPVPVTSPSGNTVLINQVGWAGLNLGIIQYEFNRLKTRDKKKGINMEL